MTKTQYMRQLEDFINYMLEHHDSMGWAYVQIGDEQIRFSLN